MANAILAAILSFIIPGLGQFYCGSMMKGLIFLVIAIILGALTSMVFIYLGIISFIFAIYAAYDAYQMASAT